MRRFGWRFSEGLAGTKVLQFSTKRFLQFPNAAIYKALLTLNIKLQMSRVFGQKHYRNTTSPRKADLQVNVRICVSQVSNDERRRSDPVLNPYASHHLQTLQGLLSHTRSLLFALRFEFRNGKCHPIRLQRA